MACGVTIFTKPSARAGYDTLSVFKRSFTGLNSEFSFSLTSCLTKAWRNQSVLLFTHSWRETNWIHTFPKGISAMWNAINPVQDLNSCRRAHFLQRKLHHITPQTPLLVAFGKTLCILTSALFIFCFLLIFLIFIYFIFQKSLKKTSVTNAWWNCSALQTYPSARSAANVQK